MSIFNLLFGKKDDKIKAFQSQKAVIIDVRTPNEYNQGAIPGSKNMPLQTINSKIEVIKKYNKPVIVCCASGMRSTSAASILKANNIEVINGGGWASLQNKLQP